MKLTWIHLEMDIFDNAKIKRIRRMPDGDKLFVLWVGLLTLGMKSKRYGILEIGDGIPYSAEDLSIEFGIPIDTVNMGVAAFEKLHMIRLVDGTTIEIINFRKYQNIDRIEHVSELNRIRQRKHREKQRLEIEDASKEKEAKAKEKDVTDDRRVSNALHNTIPLQNKEQELPDNKVIGNPCKKEIALFQRLAEVYQRRSGRMLGDKAYEALRVFCASDMAKDIDIDAEVMYNTAMATNDKKYGSVPSMVWYIETIRRAIAEKPEAPTPERPRVPVEMTDEERAELAKRIGVSI